MESERGTFIRFFPEDPVPGQVTARWSILPADLNCAIGVVKWYGPWRKYCFFPFGNGVFEWVCLREIAGFCERKTREHKAGKETV